MKKFVLFHSRTYNRLITFAHPTQAQKIIETIEGDHRVSLMTDSGAYSRKVDIDAYMAFLQRHGKTLDCYVNADVIGNGERSWRNYQLMRKKGFKPIPVWHAETDVKYLLRYLDDTGYVGIGGIAGKGNTSKKNFQILDPIFREHLLDSAGFPKVRLHAFGLSFEVLKRYPFWSADSAGWAVAGGKYYTLFIPKLKNGKWDFLEIPRKIRVGTELEDLSKHLLTLPGPEREEVMRYLEENGFRYGVFKYEGKTRVDIIDGLFNTQPLRDRVNVLFYLNFVKSLPPWPWPLRFVD